MSPFEQLTEHREPLTDELKALALAHREELVEPLVELLRGDHRPRLLRALELLTLLGAREAEGAIADLFGHRDSKVRRPAVLAAAELFRDEPPAPDTLLLLEQQYFEETIRSCENAIMDTMVGFPQRSGLPGLMRLCGSGGDLGTRRMLLRLRKALEGEPTHVWEEAMSHLTEYGRDSLERCADFEPLKSLCKKVDSATREPHELDGFGKLLTPSEHELQFPEELLEAAIERLSETSARHLLVVGPAGVGKSAFLEEVFRRLQTGRGATVLKTNTSTLMAGTKYIGEWQTRVQSLITKASRPRDVIIWMEDANNLPFTGVYENSTASFASLMKPFMEDGTITIVGETTPEALAVGLGTKPDFRRMFTELKLETPGTATLHSQLAAVVERLSYEADRELRLPDSARDRLISLAESFVAGVSFPGRAVPFLRGAVALLPPGGDAAELTSDLLVRSAAQSTGLPLWLLEDKSPLDLRRARDFFNGHVVGQDEPVEAMLDLITLIKAGLTDPTRPQGVYLFIGPTGVGKTELAKSLAEFVFGSRERLVRVDMSEFKDYDSYRRLIGSEHGSDKEGLLTGKIKQHPFSVILLDEFEKAHPNVYDLMLGLFDDGRLTTGRGETVNFCSTIIIMTSNLGQSASHDSSLGILARTNQVSDRDTVRAVEGYFSPEFINRIRLSMFRPLDLPAMQTIARREMNAALRRSGIARRDLVVDADDSVVGLLLQRGFTPRYGARPLKRAVEELFLLPIARQLVKAPPNGGVMRVRAGDDGVKARYLVEKSQEFQEARLPGGATVQELEKRWKACSAQVVEQKLEAEYAALVEQTSGPEVWERDEARVLGARLHRLETLLGSWRELGDRLERFGLWLAAGSREKSGNQRHAQAAKAYTELTSALDMIDLKLRCRDPLSQRDAYLRLRPLGAQLPERDGLKLLLEMYRGWAARMDAELLLLHDPPDSVEPTLVLRVVGPASYGLLRQESGLHRFSTSRKGESGRRQSALVRVDVVPATPDEQRLAEAEVHGEGGLTRSQSALYGERPRSWYSALHVESSTLAEGRNSLELSENERSVKEYLAALVAWNGRGAEGRVVRSYYLEPESEVLDAPSGLRSRRLENVLAGELEPFLLGGSASR